MQERIKNSIKSYLEGNDNRPLIVDVSSVKDRDDFLQSHFQTMKKSVFDLAPNNAELHETSSLFKFMSNSTENTMIITDLGTYLKLYGLDLFEQIIHSLLGKSYATKFIILTFQCSKFIHENNPRNRNKVLIDDSDYSIPAPLVFIDSEFKDFVSAEDGLNTALKRIERANDKLYVLTHYLSLIHILKKDAFESFDDLLVEVIRDNKLFDKERAFEYLQENDFILTKKVKNIDYLINKAKN